MADINHKNDIVHINCFKHKYEDGTMIDLCNTHFCAKIGEIVVICGPNGSGKSTLLNHIVGLLEPTKGVIKVMGIDVSTKWFEEIRKHIGVVFQDVDEQLIASTVFEDILFSPLNYGIEKSEAIKMAEEVMSLLDISHLRNKAPHYLSGGEKKKVALAGAIIMKPKLLVLDELFSNMDNISKIELTKILLDLKKRYDMTIIMTSHESEVINRFNARIFSLT